MSLENQFNTFHKNLLLTTQQEQDAQTKYNGVCSKLHQHYYPNSEYNGQSKFLIGSYAKNINIRPARDIDVIFIMPPEVFERLKNLTSNPQSQLLQEVRKILQNKYPNTVIKAFGKIVLLEFTEAKHNIEILPAWRNPDGTFTIPNSEKDGIWEIYDPQNEIDQIAKQDKITGQTRRLIRMIKKWAEKCSIDMKSFIIEKSVLKFLQTYSDQLSTPLLIKNYFEFAYQNEIEPSKKTYLNSAFNRAEKALNFEKKGQLQSATIEWKKIFGDDFPSIPKSSSRPTPIINPPKPWISL